MKPETVEVQGKKVRYRSAGTGPVMVLIPGLGLSSRFYEQNIEGIAQRGIRVVAPDMPGFGGTRGKLTGLNVREAADFMIDFANALDIRRAVWVGHSIGCQVALLLAAERHERTSGLVLTAPTGASVKRLLHQMTSLARDAVHEGVRVIGAVARDYVRTSPFHYIGWWLKAGKDRPLDHARRVRAPALILIGDEDPVAPPAFVAELAQRLSDARVERVPGGYHALPVGKAADFNRIVSEFVLLCNTKLNR